MATVVVMPQLGNSVESCLIVSWQVGVDDEIAEDAIVCEVETDKASMEVPASAGGTVPVTGPLCLARPSSVSQVRFSPSKSA